jgi:hypothetical protein
VSLRPIVTAANRNKAAAGLEDRFVRDDNILPPVILLPGARQSHDVKCLARRNGDVRDNMMLLQVHLHHRFLHVLNECCKVLHLRSRCRR